MENLEGEHDDLVDLINSKLKDLEQLKLISSHIQTAIETSRGKQDELSNRMERLESNNVDDVLQAI